jgi:hypothetical protein
MRDHDISSRVISCLRENSRAMATAMIYPNPEKRGRGNKSEKDLGAKSFGSAHPSQARAFLAHSPPIAFRPALYDEKRDEGWMISQDGGL